MAEIQIKRKLIEEGLNKATDDLRDQIDDVRLLKQFVRETKENIDKSMALKSIGDLNTPETREFIHQVKISEAYKDDDTIREVADLYP